MSIHALIILLLVGIVAGWAAGLITKGRGLGLFGDMLVGVIGAFVGTWLLAMFDVFMGGILGLFVSAVIGAVVLLVIVSLIHSITKGK
jgi:uncharacterized membrane protein YeaQ/YmgE (transglycosylase-associated protein family)